MKAGDLVQTQNSAINGAVGTIIKERYSPHSHYAWEIEGYVVYFHTNAHRWTDQYRLVPKEQLKKVEDFS